MMIIRLAAHRAFFFHSTQWYQPESAGGLHRKKIETYRGTISSLYRAGERWRAGLIPLAAINQDFPGRAANPPNCDETLPSSNASMVGSPSSPFGWMVIFTS